MAVLEIKGRKKVVPSITVLKQGSFLTDYIPGGFKNRHKHVETTLRLMSQEIFFQFVWNKINETLILQALYYYAFVSYLSHYVFAFFDFQKTFKEDELTVLYENLRKLDIIADLQEKWDHVITPMFLFIHTWNQLIEQVSVRLCRKIFTCITKYL